MKIARLLLLTLLIHVVAVHVDGRAIANPQTVVVRSGSVQLRALLFCLKGRGPFPAILFNHGRGLTRQTDGRVEGITKLGRAFAEHGDIFMALFRPAKISLPIKACLLRISWKESAQ